MSGLYIHIPFCRKLCFYCDFHFTVTLKQKSRVVEAIGKEIEYRATEADEMTIGTIYFGGGTPSVLSIEEIRQLVEKIYNNYNIVPDPEITFEANPDDLNEKYMDQLKSQTPVNRLSIGVQSFFDKDLTFLNRRHTGDEARKAIERAKSAGFNNINIDLIYGIPGQTDENWKINLDTFLELGIPHLSAYHLTIEPKTVFGHYQKKGKLLPVDEERSLALFNILMDFADSNSLDHYEISNFARGGSYSKHNLSYWTGKPYLGFGPSAHSYNSGMRRWNQANNSLYMVNIEEGNTLYYETEIIDTEKAYNEYILTALRTRWGIDTEYIAKSIGENYARHCEISVQKFLASGKLRKQGIKYVLSREGILIADYIISELMR